MRASVKEIVLVKHFASWIQIQKTVFSKDWARSVPAAAVIPTVRMMINIGFKTWEACLKKCLKHFYVK